MLSSKIFKYLNTSLRETLQCFLNVDVNYNLTIASHSADDLGVGRQPQRKVDVCPVHSTEALRITCQREPPQRIIYVYRLKLNLRELDAPEIFWDFLRTMIFGVLAKKNF